MGVCRISRACFDRRLVLAGLGRGENITRPLLMVHLIPQLVLEILVQRRFLHVEPPAVIALHAPGRHFVARFLDERVVAPDAGVGVQRRDQVLLQLEQRLDHRLGGVFPKVEHAILAHDVFQLAVRVPQQPRPQILVELIMIALRVDDVPLGKRHDRLEDAVHGLGPGVEHAPVVGLDDVRLGTVYLVLGADPVRDIRVMHDVLVHRQLMQHLRQIPVHRPLPRIDVKRSLRSSRRK